MAGRPSTRLIRKAQRELIEPAIMRAGFAGKYPRWQRNIGDEIHFLCISPAKYGGAFGIHGAWGKLAEFGDHAPSLAATDFDNRAAITRAIPLWRVDGSPWTFRPKMFEYHLISDDAAECRSLVAEAADALPALMAWFDTKQMTKQLGTIYDRIDSAPNPDLGRLIARAKAELGLY